MKVTVTVLAAIMLAIASVQFVKAQSESEPPVEAEGAMGVSNMDNTMMDEGMGMGMGEGGEDWSLEEGAANEGAKAMDKAMGAGMEVNKTE